MSVSHAQRLWRHLVTDHLSVRRAFPRSALDRIEQAIAAGERSHRGQVCFAVEGSLHPLHVLRRLTPRERALEVFGLLRVWDTEENSGVLIYLLLADRDVEIVADRGIDQAAGATAWHAISTHMESAFARGDYADGALGGIGEVSALLARHFPRNGTGSNELPDKPVVL
ncbi:MAG TPA: TPM domain-containing protein [Casimicrobiaceae bacterium]|nr:TPM domain-containing protein [Casimicrobiaceae bacterium]